MWGQNGYITPVVLRVPNVGKKMLILVKRIFYYLFYLVGKTFSTQFFTLSNLFFLLSFETEEKTHPQG